MKEYILQLENEELKVNIIRSRRKTLALEIKNGQIYARIPNRLSNQDTITFIIKHKDWISRKWNTAHEKEKKEKKYPVTPVSELSSEELENIKRKFTEKVRYYADKMQVSYGRITIRNQKTRWGSCSSKGNLNFNYQLYYFPESLMDYVIIHELAHRVHMNHSKEFWGVVERYCPEYMECRRELKGLG